MSVEAGTSYYTLLDDIELHDFGGNASFVSGVHLADPGALTQTSFEEVSLENYDINVLYNQTLWSILTTPKLSSIAPVSIVDGTNVTLIDNLVDSTYSRSIPIYPTNPALLAQIPVSTDYLEGVRYAIRDEPIQFRGDDNVTLYNHTTGQIALPGTEGIDFQTKTVYLHLYSTPTSPTPTGADFHLFNDYRLIRL